MPRLIETPEQELQHMIGQLIWENTALRHQVDALNKHLQSLSEPAPPDGEASAASSASPTPRTS